MSPLIQALIFGAVGLGAGLAIGFVLAGLGVRRERAQRAVEQRQSVFLYLSRRVEQDEVDIGDYSPKQTYDEVLSANDRMARRLLEHERKQIELGDTQELSLSLAATTEIRAPKKKD